MWKLIFLTAFLTVNASPALLEIEPVNRIIGGRNTWIEDFPYQVSLEKDNTYHCGGSIISAKYILTAGHCIERLTPERMRVRVGSSWKGKYGTLHSVKRLISHEGYYTRKDFVPFNDIALIELAKPIIFDKTCKAIELFDANEKIPRGAKGVVTGWGTTGCFFYLGRLQTVILPIVPTALCRKAYSEKPGKIEPYISDGQMCAGFLGERGRTSPCKGDSGGPLAIDGRLAGVVSWGSSCLNGQFPSVYTEVSHYRDWINKTAGV